MKNIKVLESGIDVSTMLKEIQAKPDNWFLNTFRQETLNSHSMSQVIHLTNGRAEVPMRDDDTWVSWIVRELPRCHITSREAPYYDYPTLVGWVEERFPQGNLGWIRVIKLPGVRDGGCAHAHRDGGRYYRPRDRYQLCLQGSYQWTVGDETIVVKAGDFLWFKNGEIHHSEVLSEEERIAVVIDADKGFYYTENTNSLAHPLCFQPYQINQRWYPRSIKSRGESTSRK